MHIGTNCLKSAPVVSQVAVQSNEEGRQILPDSLISTEMAREENNSRTSKVQIPSGRKHGRGSSQAGVWPFWGADNTELPNLTGQQSLESLTLCCHLVAAILFGALWIRMSTTPGSASVDVSPRSSCEI